MAANKGYSFTESDGAENKPKHNGTWSENVRGIEEKVYTFEEAITLTGSGCYNIGLGAVVSLALLAMCVEIFVPSMVVSACSCEFQMDAGQKGVFLSMPIVGAIIMFYPWGYVADTQGRKKSLIIAMMGSFLTSIISAFSTNWVVLTVLRLLSSSFSSGAQSITFALLGESTPRSIRDMYMLLMSSVTMTFIILCYVQGYFVLNLDFSYNLGFITFTPWRLLLIVYSFPLGISALALFFFYESPRFLVNAGFNDRAVDVLRKMFKRNGGKQNYPVKKLISNEFNGGIKSENTTFLRSLWMQIAPLFKPPLLWPSIQLYYLIIIMVGYNTSLLVWFPSIANAFSDKLVSLDPNGNVRDLCDVIISTQSSNASVTSHSIDCSSTVDRQMMWIGLGEGLVFFSLNLLISRLASRRKTVLITLTVIASASAVGTTLVSDAQYISSLVLYFASIITCVGVSIVYTYIVEIFPTSHRGMSACLGAMCGRISSLIGVNMFGYFVMSHCYTTFYTIGAILSSAVVVTCFLPPDRPKNRCERNRSDPAIILNNFDLRM